MPEPSKELIERARATAYEISRHAVADLSERQVDIATVLIATFAASERQAAMEAISQIVREEWHRAVSEFALPPGTPTEAATARILTRICDLKESGREAT